jgi:uncharacterized membrane protein
MQAPAVTPLAKLGLVFAAFLSVGVAGYAFAFYFMDTVGDPQFKTRFATVPVFAAFHVLGAGIAMLIGPFQFSSRLRARAVNVHRWLGRIYLSAVLIGGIGGFMLAMIASGGLVARVGFALLAVVWLVSGLQAYVAVRRGDLVRHRRWMIRNFALTFAAVTLRLHLPLLTFGFGVPFDEAYPVVAWLAWVPNLIVAEWLLLEPRGRTAPQVERANQRSSAFAND